MHIRPFVDADYPAVTTLFNNTYSEFAKDVDEMRFRDCHYPPECRHARWTAHAADGEVIGCAEYSQSPYVFDPHKFELDLAVKPECYGHGVGRALYATVLDALMEFEPSTVYTWCRQDMPCRLGFLQRRGFVAEVDLLTSALDLTTFAWPRWQHRLDALEQQCIKVTSLAELGVSNPAVQHNAYDLWCEVRHDVPLPAGDVRTPVPFASWWEHLAEAKAFFPEAYFIALDRECFVGTSQLFRSPIEGELRTGLTAVRRSHRRRGIAIGLKVHALRFAQRMQARRVITDNAAENEGMLAINRELGFVPNPAWTRYEKTFRPERDSSVNK